MIVKGNNKKRAVKTQQKISIKRNDIFVKSIDDFEINFSIPFLFPKALVKQQKANTIELTLSTTKFVKSKINKKMFNSTKLIIAEIKRKKESIIQKQVLDVNSYLTNDGKILESRLNNSTKISSLALLRRPATITKRDLLKSLSSGKDPSIDLIDININKPSNIKSGTTSSMRKNVNGEKFSSEYTFTMDTKKIKNRRRTINMNFDISLRSKYARLNIIYAKFVVRSKSGKIVSSVVDSIYLKKIINEHYNTQTKPLIHATQSYTGNRITVEPTSTNTKIIEVYKKDFSSRFKERVFIKIADVDVKNMKSASFVDPGHQAAIYRAVVKGQSEFSSAVVGNASNSEIDNIVVCAYQTDNSIYVGAYSLPINTINVLLYKKTSKINKYELYKSERVKNKNSVIFLDEKVKNYTKYEYKVVAVISGGVEKKSSHSNVVEFINRSEKFSLSVNATKISNTKIEIQAKYEVPETDSSMLLSSIKEGFPELRDKDMETIVKNFKQVCLVLLKRKNNETGEMKIIGYDSNIDDGKITFVDKIESYGNYSYIGTLFSRSIGQTIADIKTSGGFLKHKQKFMQYIPDELTNKISDLNFKEKFMSPRALFDGTLTYGKALAYQPENIIEIGKTGVTAISESIDVKGKVQKIYKKRIIETNNGTKISFSVTNSRNIDSYMLKTETAIGKVIQASLIPIDGNVVYTDYIHKKGDGHIKYSVLPVYFNMNIGQEISIGSVNMGDKLKKRSR
jgi:hypothetical protein